jgi:transcriptional regulator with XRE-family HTH domain
MSKRPPLVGDPIISANIKRALETAGMAPSELARRIQVSPQAVSQWMSVKTTPSAKHLAEIAEQLQIPIDYFRQSPDASLSSMPISIREDELVTMEKVYQLLRRQPAPARRRILTWLCDRFATEYDKPDD